MYRSDQHYVTNGYDERPSPSATAFPSESRPLPDDYRPRSQSADTRRAGFGQSRRIYSEEHHDDISPSSYHSPNNYYEGTLRRTAADLDFPSISREHRAEQHASAIPRQQQQQFNSPAHNFTQHLRERSPSSSSALLNLLQRYPSARQSVYSEATRIVPADERPVDTRVYRPSDVSAGYPLVEVSVPKHHQQQHNSSSGYSTHTLPAQHQSRYEVAAPRENSVLSSSYHNEYRSSPVYSRSAAAEPRSNEVSSFDSRSHPYSNGFSDGVGGRDFDNRSVHKFYTDGPNNNHLPQPLPPRNNQWPEFLDVTQLDSLLASVLDDNMNKSTAEWRSSFAQMQNRFKTPPPEQPDYSQGFASSGAPTLPRRGPMLSKSSSQHDFPERSQLSSAVERRAAEAPEFRKSGALDNFWTQTVQSRPSSPPIQRIPTSLTAAERLQLLQEPADGRSPTPVAPQRMGSGSALAARRDSYLMEAMSTVPPLSTDSSLRPSAFSSPRSPNFSELDNAVEEFRTGVRSTGYSQSARRLGGCARFPTDDHAFSPPRNTPISRKMNSPSPTDSASETSSVYQVPTGLPHPRPKHNIKEQMHQASIQNNYFPRTTLRIAGPNFPVPSTGSVSSRITEFEKRPGTPTLQLSSVFRQEHTSTPGPMSPRSTVFRSKPVIHVDLGTQHSRTPHHATTSFDFPMKHPWNEAIVSDLNITPQLQSSPPRYDEHRAGFDNDSSGQYGTPSQVNGHSKSSSDLETSPATSDSSLDGSKLLKGITANRSLHEARGDESLHEYNADEQYRPARPFRVLPPHLAGGRQPPASPALPKQPLLKHFPEWYFPQGKPVSPRDNDAALKRVNSVFQQCPHGELVLPGNETLMESVCKEAGLPVFFSQILYNAITRKLNGPARQTDFAVLWRAMTSVAHDEAARFIYMATGGRDTKVSRKDLEPMIRNVIQTHPGMDFYKDAVEFHDKYVDVVTTRIFWEAKRPWAENLIAQDIRRSGLMTAVRSLEENADINKESRFFSYEHFYVAYCKFWELDTDHDMCIHKKDLLHYGSGAMPSLVVDRIFLTVLPTGAKTMNIAQFTQLLLADEHKNHPSSVAYWFRVLDEDGDGIISLYDIHTYQEQIELKLAEQGNDTLSFPDIACQLIDSIKPALHHQFTIKDLRGNRLAKRFFNSLVNWRKFYFQEVNEASDSASVEDETGRELNDWERFCAEEYEVLRADASEDGDDDDVENYNVYVEDDDEGSQGASFHDLL